MIEKFVLFQVIIVVFFGTGCWVSRRFSSATTLPKRVININLIFIEPFIVLWSVWGLALDMDLLILPLSGILMALVGIFTGTILNRLLRLTDKKKTTFLISSCLSNQGFTMGGFLCYICFGEKGLAMSVIFMTFFIPLIFLGIFPYARTVGWRGQQDMTIRHQLKYIFWNLQNMPLFAMVIALILQFTGIPRPAYSLSLDPLLLLSVSLYYLSLGANFQFVNLAGAFKEHLTLAGIKFLIIPLSTFLVLDLIPLNATVKQVIMIQSIMPVAVYSVVTSILFELDSKLALGMFVVNTALFLVLILPLLMLVGGAILAML